MLRSRDQKTTFRERRRIGRAVKKPRDTARFFGNKATGRVIPGVQHRLKTKIDRTLRKQAIFVRRTSKRVSLLEARKD